MRGRATVLLVEDDDDIRELARTVLERRGFDVLLADNAANAILKCRIHDGAIDVLLTDLGLPGVSGGELSRSAATLRPTMGVVYVSGLPRQEAIAQGLVTPESVWVGKPFSADSLVGAVQRVLDSRPGPGP